MALEGSGGRRNGKDGTMTTVVGSALGDTRPEHWERKARSLMLPLLEEVLAGTQHDLILDGEARSLYLRWVDGPRMEAMLSSAQVLLGPLRGQFPHPLQVEMDFPEVNITLQRDISPMAQALAALVLHQRRGCPYCRHEHKDYQGEDFGSLVLTARPQSPQSYGLMGRQERLLRHANVLGGLCTLENNLAGSEEILTAQFCLMGHTGGLVALERTLDNKDKVLGVRLPHLRKRETPETESAVGMLITPPGVERPPAPLLRTSSTPRRSGTTDPSRSPGPPQRLAAG